MIPIPRAYSESDTMVRFVNAHVIMTGEFFHSVSYPDIDRGNRGTQQGTFDGLGTLVALAGPKTRIVPQLPRSAT